MKIRKPGAGISLKWFCGNKIAEFRGVFGHASLYLVQSSPALFQQGRSSSCSSVTERIYFFDFPKQQLVMTTLNNL